MTDTALPLDDEPEIKRLARYLQRSSGFMLGLVHAPFPLAAERLLGALTRALEARAGRPPRLVSLDPYEGRTNPASALEKTSVFERLLLPLVEGPLPDSGPGSLLIVDGSPYLPEDEAAWRVVFGAMNEQRNSITQRLNCAMLLLGPVELLDLFMNAAPDFWAVRSGEFGEGIANNGAQPLSYEGFLAAVSGQGLTFEPPLDDLARSALAAFLQLAAPTEGEVLIVAEVRDTWRQVAMFEKAVSAREPADIEQQWLKVSPAFERLKKLGDVGFVLGLLFALHRALLLRGQVLHERGECLAAHALLLGWLGRVQAEVPDERREAAWWFRVQARALRARWLEAEGSRERAAALAVVRVGDEPARLGRAVGSELMAEVMATLGQLDSARRAWGQAAEHYLAVGNDQATRRCLSRLEGISPLVVQAPEQITLQSDGGEGTEPTKPQPTSSRKDEVWHGSPEQAHLMLQRCLDTRASPTNKERAALLVAIPWLMEQFRVGEVRELTPLVEQLELESALATYLASAWLPADGDRANHYSDVALAGAIRSSRTHAFAAALVTKGDALVQDGNIKGAMASFLDALDVLSASDDVEEATKTQQMAVVRVRIADVFQRRGLFDEALRTLRLEVLPPLEGIGDIRSVAVARGKIADILQARGQLEEALRIRKEEELPVYEKLGDVRSVAVVKGKMAHILQLRGGLDDALRIVEEEVLPALDRLGDIRSVATAKGQVADILERRGNLEDALRIRKKELLPVFERLGDIREVALAKGKIADIMQARGNLEEALRIRKREELPIYRKLGDTLSVAVAMGKVADVFQARGQLDEALRIRKEDELPLFEKLGDVRSVAISKGRIADILATQGDLDEAIRILTQDVLPTLDCFGYAHPLLAARVNLALLLIRRGSPDDAAEAARLLRLAYQAALTHGYAPDAAQLEAVMQRLGVLPT